MTGLGMRTGPGVRPEIDMFIGAEQYCPPVSEEDGGNGCFSVKTDNSQFMKDLFGPDTGGVLWDDYYDIFYAKGCRGVHYGTSKKTSNAVCLEGANPANTKWRLSTPYSLQVIKDKNETIVEETLTPAEKAIRDAYLNFDLEYCCVEQQCDSGGSGLRLGTSVVMAAFVGAMLLNF